MKNILADVEIPSSLPLEAIAVKLGSLMSGINFEREETGRFEEVPAFTAADRDSGLTFILFGIPEGEICDVYTLECSAETDQSIEEFGKATPCFFRKVFVDKEINSRGYFDYSEELANALTNEGILASSSSL